jgi:putative aldouronate transport system permease protein
MARTRAKLSDGIATGIIDLVLCLSALLAMYPLYFVLIGSISNPNLVNAGKVWILPAEVTFDGYRRILRDATIWGGYANTILYATSGTAVNLALTLTAGYALSRNDLVGRKALMMFLLFTMFFQGGIIPRYLLLKQLGMINTAWSMILPNAVRVWNLIVTVAFFRSTIPEELREAAVLDGCGNSRFFMHVVLPVSPALIAVMTLFYGVGHWNAFFDALMFLNDPRMYPLQLVLRNILLKNQSDLAAMDAESFAQMEFIAELVKYGIIVVASVPMLVLYPFLQKYFVKGVLVGAIKG